VNAKRALVTAWCLPSDVAVTVACCATTLPALQVSTAQYFVWYFCLIPLVLPRLRLTRGLCWALGCWVAAQLHWLLWGYLLEFQVRAVGCAWCTLLDGLNALYQRSDAVVITDMCAVQSRCYCICWSMHPAAACIIAPVFDALLSTSLQSPCSAAHLPSIMHLFCLCHTQQAHMQAACQATGRRCLILPAQGALLNSDDVAFSSDIL
jgi:hypothetical protein